LELFRDWQCEELVEQAERCIIVKNEGSISDLQGQEFGYYLQLPDFLEIRFFGRLVEASERSTSQEPNVKAGSKAATAEGRTVHDHSNNVFEFFVCFVASQALSGDDHQLGGGRPVQQQVLEPKLVVEFTIELVCRTRNTALI
jgi:hypothetical protein